MPEKIIFRACLFFLKKYLVNTEIFPYFAKITFSPLDRKPFSTKK